MTDRELMQMALDWADNHGEVVFAGGGWNAVNPMNEWTRPLRARLAQPEPTVNGWPLYSGLPQNKLGERELVKIRQTAWKAVPKEHIDDPECCFALGFDAGYDAVALRAEPPVSESGGGFESLPASPKREWVGMTDEEIGNVIEVSEITLKNYCSEDKQTEYARAIEAKLKEKNG